MQQLCKSQIVKLQALKADTLKKEDTVFEKELKISHSTLRAKRAKVTFWVDKSSSKWQMSKKVLPDKSLLNGQEMVKNDKMRHFEWFSNNV